MIEKKFNVKSNAPSKALRARAGKPFETPDPMTYKQSVDEPIWEIKNISAGSRVEPLGKQDKQVSGRCRETPREADTSAGQYCIWQSPFSPDADVSPWSP